MQSTCRIIIESLMKDLERAYGTIGRLADKMNLQTQGTGIPQDKRYDFYEEVARHYERLESLARKNLKRYEAAKEAMRRDAARFLAKR